MTDVSAGFRPPCWCPSRWAPAWHLHTNLYKSGENVSPHIFHKKNCCDLNLGESLCISTFFLFSDFHWLNGFYFLFWSILNGVTLKTSNYRGAPVARRAAKRSTILIKERKGNPCMDFLMVFMTSGNARRRPRKTTTTTSRHMVTILQKMGFTETCSLAEHLWYWTSVLWSIDIRQNIRWQT